MSAADATQAFGRIVIVGGGAAGWMTATALCTALGGRSAIQVVESAEIGIVGVGEATFPSIREYNRLVGIDERDFLRVTQGSFKLGNRFCDWLQPGSEYFHGFADLGQLRGPHALWGQHRRLGLSEPLGLHCMSVVMANQGRFVLPDPQDAPFDYAYHFDAQLYADYLRQLALRRGVQRTQATIVEVERRADGAVAAVRLSDGGRIEGDLFVDCSGFRSLLLGQALAEPYVDFSRWLPMDGAWACPAQRQDETLTPFTRATALEAGWAWRIPLRTRTGHGHVFSSRFIDPERAREQLLARLDGKPLAEPRLLRFTAGHRQRLWVNNVVAIGLASGFLEPLESTSIYLIQSGIGRLIEVLNGTNPVNAEAVARYNEGAVQQYVRIRDFIIMHYCLTRRRDSELWRYVSSMELPPTLAFKLELWRRYGVLHQYNEEGFDATSWLVIHAGMEHWPERADPVFDEVELEDAGQALRARLRTMAALVEPLPRHHEFLAHYLR